MNVPGDVPYGDTADVVVLDTSWTPDGPEAAGPIPVRPTLTTILDAENLFLTSLSLFDAWADACGLPERFSKDGVTWWFHARSFVRLDLQELLLWSRVLDLLAPEGAYDTIVVPQDRHLLADAIRARVTRTPGPEVRLEAGSSLVTSDISGRPAIRAPKPRRRFHPLRAIRSMSRFTWAVLRTGRRPTDRRAVIADRLNALAATPGSLLCVVRATSFHHVETGGELVRRDPYVGPVVQHLKAAGLDTVTLALTLGHAKLAHWQQLETDTGLLPHSILGTLPDGPTEADTARYEVEIAERLAAMPAVPIRDGDRDLGPAIAATVCAIAPWVSRQWRDMDRAGRLMDILRPGAMLTGWEGARTSWLGAARRRGIPSVAIQHGVIYPDTPDYCRPAHPALVTPDMTCVYGPYERGILTGQGGYAEDAVVATGSPRVDPAPLDGPQPEPDRAAVRNELGVADGYRMLVVSGGRMTVGDRLSTVPLVARVLDGPLPGVHIVIKLHPEEHDGEHYRDLLTGLARAGGYDVPPITIIRDIDLYRLLRAANAHLGVFSTVLTDSVLAGVPNMIVVGQAQADLLGYVEAGVAAPVRSVGDVRAFMADPQPPADEARRRFIEAHFVAGDASARIADLIRSAVVAPRDAG